MNLRRVTVGVLLFAAVAAQPGVAAAVTSPGEIGQAWTRVRAAATDPTPAPAGTPVGDGEGEFTAAGYTASWQRWAGTGSGLLVVLDGTGENGVDNPESSYMLGGSNGVLAAAANAGLAVLAPQSPNQSSEQWHTGDTSGYADWLAALIAEQHTGGDLWLFGYSSGAQEITRFLLPQHPEVLTSGGFVVVGGGGPPAGGGMPSSWGGGVRGHWYTGTADTGPDFNAYSGPYGAQAGEAWYAANTAVTTSHEWPAGVGHSLSGEFGQILAGQLG